VPDLTAKPRKASLRLLLTSESETIPELTDVLARPIKLVPLAARKVGRSVGTAWTMLMVA
jgi:hypothetical protein